MASLSDISAAARDQDLTDRFISAAAEAGIASPESWVMQNSRRLVSSTVSAESQEMIADVYAFARHSRPPAPGANPAAVLDSYIRSVVERLNT